MSSTASHPAYPPLALHVAGRWLTTASGGRRVVRDPSSGEPLAELPLAGQVELEAAAECAERGFRLWRRQSPLQRQAVLHRAANLMRERAPAMAQVLTLEQGKPLAEALREVTLSADILDFQAEEAKRLYGRTVAPRVPGIVSHQVLRAPVGPVAAFTPWNFPVNLPVRKLASALAAGCSVVLKPDEHTPASAMGLMRCLLDAGLPPEVVSLVCGDPPEVSSTLIAHPAIAKVSITGSVAVGTLLAEQAAHHMKRYTGELGGHAPVIVAEDMCSGARLAQVVDAAVAAKYRNAGQVCASPIRFYLPRAHQQAFATALAERAAALRLGPGLDAATQMGPLTHPGRLDDMAHFVDDALDQGARLVTGGQRVKRAGYFFEPTVFCDAPPESRLMRAEPFGPIAVVQGYDTLDEAIAAANSLPMGLAAYAWTGDLRTAHRLGEELEAGMVGLNHYGVSQPELPFGGWKQSGIGQEMGAEGLLHYTEVKTITLALPG